MDTNDLLARYFVKMSANQVCHMEPEELINWVLSMCRPGVDPMDIDYDILEIAGYQRQVEELEWQGQVDAWANATQEFCKALRLRLEKYGVPTTYYTVARVLEDKDLLLAKITYYPDESAVK
jgi:hypothetical protein